MKIKYNMKYIDKSALVAEIKRRLQEEYPCDNSEQTTGYHCALYELQDFLGTLEEKEVDLKEEFDKCCGNYIFDDECEEYTARHFFELGFKAQEGVNLEKIYQKGYNDAIKHCTIHS